MAGEDVAAQLAVKSPRRVLEELAKISAKLASMDRPRPEVELYLVSGQTLRGRVVSVGDDQSTPMLVLVVGGQPRAPSVAYVRVDHIVALQLGDASLLVKPIVSDEPAPSKLELARALGARSESLTTALGRALPMSAVPELDDDGRRAVAAVLTSLVDSLRAISRDAMGKEALDKLAGIELSAGNRQELRRDGDKVTLVAARLATDAWTSERLRNELEKLL
jgi:hypothetical protein